MLRAEFLSRPNRFVAFCRLPGQEEPVRAHVPNTGRLRELLVAGTEALLRENPPGGKTQYTLCAVRHEGRWVSVDSQLPNRVAAEALARREIPGFFGYASVRREVSCGNSRFDAALLDAQGEPVCFVEVKGVTLVENGVARFPDAPTERGTKHLRELTRLAREAAERGNAAQEQIGQNCLKDAEAPDRPEARAQRGAVPQESREEALPAAAVLFLIQREDALAFAPNERTDPAFCAALRGAAEAGVRVLALRCAVDERGMRILSEVPVRL